MQKANNETKLKKSDHLNLNFCKMVLTIIIIVLFYGQLAALELPASKWKAVNYTDTMVRENTFRGTTIVVAGKKTPFLYSPKLEELKKGKYILSCKIHSSENGKGKLFYRSLNERFSENRVVSFSVEKSKKFKVYRISLPESAPLQFRLDFIIANGTKLEIEGFKLLPGDELPEFSEWEAIFYDNITASGNSFEGETIFERGKKTPFLLSPPLSIAGNTTLSFEMSSGKSGQGKLFYRYGHKKFCEAWNITFRVKGDGKFHIYHIRLPDSQDKITQLRLDSILRDGVQIKLKNLCFRILHQMGNYRFRLV
jgi:hypothetical protein